MFPLKRIEIPERMDDPEIPLQELHKALKDLARLNGMFGGRTLILKKLDDLFLHSDHEPIRILDVGTGGADIPVSILQWANKKNKKVEVYALDFNKNSLIYARDNSGSITSSIRFICGNVHQFPFMDGAFDLIIASLFLHHFSYSESVELLKNFRALTRKAVLINDLERSRKSLFLIFLGTRLFTRSSIVHYDSLVSVRRAFTEDELKELAIQAGYNDFKVTTHFPCRLVLSERVDS